MCAYYSCIWIRTKRKQENEKPIRKKQKNKKMKILNFSS